MWTIEDANEFTKWDKRITVIDQFPMYRNISTTPIIERRYPTIHGLQ